MFDFLVDALAVWRLSEMVTNERGPLDLLVRLRALTGVEEDVHGTTVVHNMITPLWCVLCTSIWVAGVMGLVPLAVRRAFALSAAAVLLNKYGKDL